MCVCLTDCGPSGWLSVFAVILLLSSYGQRQGAQRQHRRHRKRQSQHGFKRFNGRHTPNPTFQCSIHA